MTLTNKNAFQKDVYLPLFTVRGGLCPGISVQGGLPTRRNMGPETETPPPRKNMGPETGTSPCEQITDRQV